MSRRKPKTGQLGQSSFQALCDAAGVTVNPAIDDNEGWDFLIEFPAPTSTLSADRAPRGTSAFVQVKATRDPKKRTCQVKLSNALRFAKNPNACFTVLLHLVDGDIRPSKVFVRHFWRRDIEDALVAARKASVGGKPLHRKSITVQFEDSEFVSMSDLLDRIETAVAELGDAYPILKREAADKAGIETLRFGVAATFDGEVTPDRLLDSLLGKGEPLNVSELRVVEERFGIRVPYDVPAGPGKLTFTPTTKPIDLTIAKSDGSEAVRIAGTASGAILPTRGDALRKLRVQADFIEFETDLSGSGDLSIRFDTTHSYSIEKIQSLAKISAWISLGPVAFSLDHNGKTLIRGTCKVDDTIGGRFWRNFDALLSDLFAVFPASAWPTAIRVTLADLIAAHRTLFQFVATLTQSDVVWTYTILDSGVPDSVMQAVPGMQGVVYFEMGELTLFAIYIATTQSVVTNENDTSLTLNQPKILRRFVLPGTATENWGFMCEQVSESRASVPDGYFLTRLESQDDGSPLIEDVRIIEH